MLMETTVRFTLNNKEVEVSVEPNSTLLDTLRYKLKFTGTKKGCERGECGACTVIVDGKAVNSCLILAPKMNNRNVLTVEGLKTNGNLHPLQTAFINHTALQCGYCTPGMLMSAKALLDSNPNPSVEEIRRAIEGNLCRCTGYVQIISAIQDAARELLAEHDTKSKKDLTVVTH